MKVLKFGGAALADADAMRRAAGVIADSGEPTIVVASAMRGVTDQIEQSLTPVTRQEAAAHMLMSELRRVHLDAAASIDSDEVRGNTDYLVQKSLDALERLLFGISYTEELTPRSHDLALSFGERLSVRILAGYLRDAGLDAEALDADKAGIVTHGPFGWASPDLASTAEAMARRVVPKTASCVPVVTGFFGADHDGHTTLFGRGGSDFSAAIVANAVDADVLEVWKESQGFMTADPTRVPLARRVPHMGYDEAAELAAFGAKILHPRTVEPVAPKDIPIRVREINDPTSPGTLIGGRDQAPECFIRGVASRDGLSVIRLIGPGMGYTPGVAADAFDLLREAQINVINMATSEASFAMLIDAAHARLAVERLSRLKGGVVQDVVAQHEMSLVAVVGKGLGERVGSAAQILQSVGSQEINIHMISLGASEIAINFVVGQSQADQALRAVHARFLENQVAAR